MRTTLSLDADVLGQAREVAEKLKQPFKLVVNEALRQGLKGLAGQPSKPYRTQPRALGLKKGVNLDNIQDLLTAIEGETYR